MLKLGVDLASLFPVRDRIFGPSRCAKINIVGGIILEILDPYNNAVRPSLTGAVHLFYVANNVSSNYPLLSTLKALKVMEPSLPRFGTAHSSMLAVNYSRC